MGGKLVGSQTARVCPIRVQQPVSRLFTHKTMRTMMIMRCAACLSVWEQSAPQTATEAEVRGVTPLAVYSNQRLYGR